MLFRNINSPRADCWYEHLLLFYIDSRCSWNIDWKTEIAFVKLCTSDISVTETITETTWPGVNGNDAHLRNGNNIKTEIMTSKTYRNGNVCNENEKKRIWCAVAVSTKLNESLLVKHDRSSSSRTSVQSALELHLQLMHWISGHSRSISITS